MAQMYFKNGEKEKGSALLARIEAANNGKHDTTTATIESRNIPDIPGNNEIDESAPNDDQLPVENHSDHKEDDDNE